MMWLEYHKQFRIAEAKGSGSKWLKGCKECVKRSIWKWYPYSCSDKDGRMVVPFPLTGTSEGKNRFGEQDVEFSF